MRTTAEKRSKTKKTPAKKKAPPKAVLKPKKAPTTTTVAPSFQRMTATTSLEGNCSNCGVGAKCRYRTFSEQAWTVLLIWKEINPAAVERPICDECYIEMREILIDRSHDIEIAMRQTDEVKKAKLAITKMVG